VLWNLLFRCCAKLAADAFIWTVKALPSPALWQLVIEASSDLVPLQDLGSLLGKEVGKKKVWELGAWSPLLRSSVQAEALTFGPSAWPHASMIWTLALTCRLDTLA